LELLSELLVVLRMASQDYLVFDEASGEAEEEVVVFADKQVEVIVDSIKDYFDCLLLLRTVHA
jgi:hypothetical protein